MHELCNFSSILFLNFLKLCMVESSRPTPMGAGNGEGTRSGGEGSSQGRPVGCRSVCHSDQASWTYCHSGHLVFIYIVFHNIYFSDLTTTVSLNLYKNFIWD